MKLIEILHGMLDGIFHEGDIVVCNDFDIRFEFMTNKDCMVSVQGREPFCVDAYSYRLSVK